MDTGPALPPHLAKKLNRDRKEKNENEEKQSCTDMSTKHQGEKSSSAHSEDSADSDECESYGPTLPPGFQKKKENVPSRTRVLGPMRPAQFDYPRTVTSRASENNVSSDDDDDDEDMIGPTPPAAADINAEFERTKMDIEVRSKAKKDQMTGKKDVKPKRETWMTELPPDLSKNFGLGPRTFRAHAVELGDQSVWTDTPEDKDKKSKEGDKGSKRGADNDEAVSRTPWELARDQQMTSQVEHYNKRHRGESLMDMHSKKIEKQKKEDKDKPIERRPFDRDQDLNVPKMSDGQKKSVIQKSKELGTRFHNSRSGSSFL